MKRAPTWVAVVLALIIIALLFGIAYLAWWKPAANTNPANTSSATINTTQNTAKPQPQDQTPAIRSYTSQKGVSIQLDNWTDNHKVASPLTITGKVPGSWSFEATFPIELTTGDGRVIAKSAASLTGDWMTTDLVPFTATLTFDANDASGTGSVILHKSNPSGLVANDDLIELKIRY